MNTRMNLACKKYSFEKSIWRFLFGAKMLKRFRIVRRFRRVTSPAHITVFLVNCVLLLNLNNISPQCSQYSDWWAYSNSNRHNSIGTVKTDAHEYMKLFTTWSVLKFNINVFMLIVSRPVLFYYDAKLYISMCYMCSVFKPNCQFFKQIFC